MLSEAMASIDGALFFNSTEIFIDKLYSLWYGRAVKLTRRNSMYLTPDEYDREHQADPRVRFGELFPDEHRRLRRELGEEFKELRTKKLHKTQQEFAEFLGISQPTISRIEAGDIASTLMPNLVIAYLRAKDKEQLGKVKALTAKSLKRKREALGLSQPQLALRLGVSRSTIARWELNIIDIKSCPMIAMAIEQLEQIPEEEYSARENAA